ncbi:MAG TPA: trehalose-6-phosphate synthase [Candidatus Limnocylindrales bacterium]|nr:trehalose-6-phosphate synthase [Candidatus Limnocylindrales bacterium]
MPSTDADHALGTAASTLLGDRRLIIATNRGPVSFASGADGSLRPRRGSGGLVTALGQVGAHVPLTWVAAAMSEGDRRAAADPKLLRQAGSDDDNVRLRFVAVERSVYEQAYNVIANPFLWFLQHQMWNLPERPVIDGGVMRAWERGYVPLNEAFASAVLAQTRGDREPRIMLHDYHLYCAAEPIRRARPRAILSHFTHIPWPPSSIWQTIAPPIREGIATGLLANDVVGFQTARYAHNFLRTVESFVPKAHVDYTASAVRWRRRTTHVRSYPISIDVGATRRVATSRAARRRADQLLGGTRERVLVRVDRLEPSKNILRGFLAYEALLQRHARLRGRISFLAFLVPSRTGLKEYGDYGRNVQDVVDRINARFGRAGWRPIQIFYENDYAQALAGLSIADVILVNPLVDGMNLVAKEAVVVNERDAVLVLAETAGAYDQMSDGALAVAPADVVGTADALATALAMDPDERRRRLARLRRGVEREDITWWLQRQLEDLATLRG